MKARFENWFKEIYYLEKVKIPRKLKGDEFCPETSTVQLHVFNDASQVAYATEIFLRVETNDNVSVQLIQSKARIAPMNKDRSEIGINELPHWSSSCKTNH